MDVVLLEAELFVQLEHLKGQRQQALGLQSSKVRSNDLEQLLGYVLARCQVAAMTDLERHMNEGVVMLAIGHAPGV